MKKAIVYGLGYNYYFGQYDLINSYDIVAITDTNAEARKWAESSPANEGLQVIEPTEINKMDYDVIVVTPKNSEQLVDQLRGMGILQDHIEPFTLSQSAPYRIDPDFFNDLDSEGKKNLFRNNVEKIVIEVNSKCNRKCWFCGNSIVDRHSANFQMTDELFIKIVQELKEIDYCGLVCYSFYNEPLLCDTLADKIRYTKDQLPSCLTFLTTNGDFLTPQSLHELSEAGLDDMIVSVYEENNPLHKWTLDGAMDTIDTVLDRLSLRPIFKEEHENTATAYASSESTSIRLQNVDFANSGGNRGEMLLSDSIPLPIFDHRSKLCCVPFFTFNIFYNGDVMPCGDTRVDYEKHADFKTGNINDNTIFEVFSGSKAKELRLKAMMDLDVFPHGSCWYDNDTWIPRYPCVPLRRRPYEIIQSNLSK